MSVLFAPIASAAVPLGGGAGIVVDGNYCTPTTIDHDSSGALIGFTAARCAGSGAQVVPEGSNAVVGSVVAADGGPGLRGDLDAAAVTPIANFAGLAICWEAFRGFVPFRGGAILPPRGNATISAVLFSAILDDVNANGGPGAGFIPVPA